MAANLDIDTLTESIHECCRERDLWDRISAEDRRFNAGKAEGLAEGETKKAKKVACSLLEVGMGLEQISKIIRLSPEETEVLLRS